MKARVAINGFGRIGRMVFRKAIVENDFDIVAINAGYPPETLAHLIKYDSNHGKFDGDVIAVEDGLIVNGKKVSLLNSRDPRLLPWGELQVDIVIEATGKFNANPHSAIVDGLSTMVIENRKVKVLAWYDNEWGYSCRVVDLTKLVAKQLLKNEAIAMS